jgi:molybdopterin converting factor small subunit
MQVSVLFFAFARDRMKTGQQRYQLAAGSTVEALYREHLAERLGAPIDQWMFSINRVWAEPSAELHDGDEVAVIPPVSGG